MLGAITMGLVDGYAGLHMSTDLQDVLLGVPRDVETAYWMGVLKEDHVNIAVHGHPHKAAEIMLNRLLGKRRALGLPCPDPAAQAMVEAS